LYQKNEEEFIDNGEGQSSRKQPARNIEFELPIDGSCGDGDYDQDRKRNN